jgi:hypothetical protein
MAKAKKSGAADGGATKKQATETKKRATDPKPRAAAPKSTRAAASETKASASATKPAASAEKESAAGTVATKKKAPARPAAGGTSSPSSIPLIDTSFAAETAANFVVNRALLGNARAGAPQEEPAEETPGEEKRESSAFKQMKAGLNKPAGQGLGGVLGNTNPGKKGNSGFGGGNQQIGRNQTFGADVTRSGVPRRTGG